MLDLFGFSMMGNYKDRKVDRFEKGKLIVDTCEVYDSDEPFETAIAHPKYNQGKFIIVEMYNSKKEAENGHKKWVKKMTSKNIPKKLEDVSTSNIKKLFNSFEED